MAYTYEPVRTPADSWSDEDFFKLYEAPASVSKAANVGPGAPRLTKRARKDDVTVAEVLTARGIAARAPSLPERETAERFLERYDAAFVGKAG